MRTTTIFLFLAALAVPPAAMAQTYDSGSDGSDGAWVVEPLVDGDGNHRVRYVDLPESGVFHFTSVHVKPGAWVRFRRNADNTPVTILSQGDVLIEGLVDASAMQWADYYRPTFVGPGGLTYARDMTAYEKGWCRNLGGAPWADLYGVGCAGGPGGFDGSSSGSSALANPVADATLVSAAFGPSGALRWADAPCFPGPGTGNVPLGGASAAYPGPCACGETTPAGVTVPTPGGIVLPVGGPGWFLTAGGSGGSDTAGNGGGGAITLASSTRVEVADSGAVFAFEGYEGGTGAGGGGTIRIVAPAVRARGDVRANQVDSWRGLQDPSGEVCTGPIARGVVRIESWSPDVDVFAIGGADPTGVFPGPQFDVPRRALPWPEAQRPRLWIDSVAGKAVVPTPRDIPPVAAPALLLPPSQPLDVVVKAQNVPAGTVVKVAMNLVGGPRTVKDAPALAGTAAASQATVSFTIPADAKLGGFEAWVERIQVAQ